MPMLPFKEKVMIIIRANSYTVWQKEKLHVKHPDLPKQIGERLPVEITAEMKMLNAARKFYLKQSLRRDQLLFIDINIKKKKKQPEFVKNMVLTFRSKYCLRHWEYSVVVMKTTQLDLEPSDSLLQFEFLIFEGKKERITEICW